MGSVNQNPLTKTPFWLPKEQTFVHSRLSDEHDEVLYRLGEYSMFTMLWHFDDFAAGLVERCATCFDPDDATERIAKAYGGQPDRVNCPDCYGTGFEGGIRAQVIRPAVVSDFNTESLDGRRGQVTTDTISAETTSDIYLRTGDFIFLTNGNRYSTVEISPLVLRTGFSTFERDETLGGDLPQCRLEDPTSRAYIIPPEPEELTARLTALNTSGRHTPEDITAYDYVPGVLVP